MDGRALAITRLRTILTQTGFYVMDVHDIRPTSFDLAARRDSLLLFFKVLKNIDALSPSEAARLRRVAALFDAHPLVVGQTTGVTALKSGIIYTRYSVPIVVEETLADYLQDGVPPFLVSSPGGVFARIDGFRLRRLREDRHLSLGGLANLVGVTRRTIQLYEEGGGADIHVVERMEKVMNQMLAMAVPLWQDREDIFEIEEGMGDTEERLFPTSSGDPFRDDVFRQLHMMGWIVTRTMNCPFDAVTSGPKEEPLLLTSIGTKRIARHRAEVLQGLARVIEGQSMFVTQEDIGSTTIDGLPVIAWSDLRHCRDRKDLIHTLAERTMA